MLLFSRGVCLHGVKAQQHVFLKGYVRCYFLFLLLLTNPRKEQN